MFLTPTMSKQFVIEHSVHRPVASAAPSLPCVLKFQGCCESSEEDEICEINTGAALKLAYVVYASSSLVYLLSSTGCVS